MLEKNDRTLFSHNLITCFSAFFIRKITHPGEQSSAITLQSFTVSYFDSEHSIQTYLLQITVCYNYCKEQSTVYLLQSTVYMLQSIVYLLQSTAYLMQSIVYLLQSTAYLLQSTGYLLQGVRIPLCYTRVTGCRVRELVQEHSTIKTTKPLCTQVVILSQHKTSLYKTVHR